MVFLFLLVLYIILIYIYNKLFNFIDTHEILKNTEKKNILNNIVSFGTNNTIFTYILLILVYLLNIKYFLLEVFLILFIISVVLHS